MVSPCHRSAMSSLNLIRSSVPEGLVGSGVLTAWLAPLCTPWTATFAVDATSATGFKR